ncbi:serine hydrolase domain-containing protein [Legionella tunisiensis]|uniref:serine hydrolase domain-containing protein n=1 Tax=Legionella tunisiensis TaxID=1034944 RepID=UPI0002EC20EF|nr:serine hydrolase [Legionella tunisiensis]
MKKLLTVFLALFAQFAVFSSASAKSETIAPDTIIKEHLRQYGPQEMFSAIQVSIKVQDKISTYTAGNRSLEPGSKAISADDLFDIGSITKSFTAAIAVMAESEGKFKLENGLNHYLPDYPHWGQLSLSGLLNMSTGIPNYSDAPRMNYLMSKNLRQYWNQSDLINLVYSKQLNPPLKPGYFYSNTGYVLMDIILSKAYKTSFKNLLSSKILTPLKLQNTFYPLPDYPVEVLQRLVRGYSYNVYDNPELLGKDVTENNLSWAGAAGALVANSEDVIHWIEHLFIDDQLLTSAQKGKCKPSSLSRQVPHWLKRMQKPHRVLV